MMISYGESPFPAFPPPPVRSSAVGCRKPHRMMHSKDEVSAYLEKHQLQAKLQEALQHVVSEMSPSPMDALSKFFAAADAEGIVTPKGTRYNTLCPSPAGAKYKLAVVQFKVPGAKNGGSDKGPDGNRVDSIPIANSVIKAGGACDLILYDFEKNMENTCLCIDSKR